MNRILRNRIRTLIDSTFRVQVATSAGRDADDRPLTVGRCAIALDLTVSSVQVSNRDDDIRVFTPDGFAKTGDIDVSAAWLGALARAPRARGDHPVIVAPPSSTWLSQTRCGNQDPVIENSSSHAEAVRPGDAAAADRAISHGLLGPLRPCAAASPGGRSVV